MIELDVMGLCMACPNFKPTAYKTDHNFSVRCENHAICERAFDLGSEKKIPVNEQGTVSIGREDMIKDIINLFYSEDYKNSFDEIKRAFGYNVRLTFKFESDEIFLIVTWDSDNDDAVVYMHIPSSKVWPIVDTRYLLWMVLYSSDYGIYPYRGCLYDTHCDMNVTNKDTVKFMNYVSVRKLLYYVSKRVGGEFKYSDSETKIFIEINCNRVFNELFSDRLCVEFNKKQLLTMGELNAREYMSRQFRKAGL